MKRVQMDSETRRELKRVEAMGPGVFVLHIVMGASWLIGCWYLGSTRPDIWESLKESMGFPFALWLTLIVPFAILLEWANRDWNAATRKRRAFYDAHGLVENIDPHQNAQKADAFLSLGRLWWVCWTIYVVVDKTITWDNAVDIVREWAKR